MKIWSFLAWLLIFFIGCNTTQKEFSTVAKYTHDVGDITFDPNVDNRDFELCDSTKITTRRHALIYAENNRPLKEICLQRFEFQPEFKSFTGFITIRFIVNCKNEADRFRVQTLDMDFLLRECPEALKNHILDLVAGLRDWRHRYERDSHLDVAKFLNFKIVNGKIIEVLQ